MSSDQPHARTLVFVKIQAAVVLKHRLPARSAKALVFLALIIMNPEPSHRGYAKTT